MQKINELKDGAAVDSCYRITDITDSTTKTGKPYKRFKLSDKTGSCPAVMWELHGITAPFVSGDIVRITGDVSLYQNAPQIKVVAIHTADPDINPSDYDAVSSYSVSEMWDTTVAYIASMKNDQVRGVAEDLFLHQGYQEAFQISPAATGMHHAFKAGLLEHTSQMLECGDVLLKLPFFSFLNRDLCLFGILFHDMGKIFEYSTDAGFKKTVQGVLVPHIPMMGALILETCNKRGVPQIVRDHLMHIVLAHHRQLEWGSPVVPAFPEAAFVHYVDNLHGNVFGMRQKIEKNPGKELVEHWDNGKISLIGQSFDDILKSVEAAADHSEVPFKEEDLPF